MSILKTIYLQHLNGSSPNATLDANGNMTVTGTVVSGSSMGMRNRIINGDMRIDQRNNGASANTGSSGGVYTLDRWTTYVTGGGVYSVQQTATAPTGFANSQIITITSADSSITAGDVYQVRTTIEGLNCADLAWGTSSASPVTLSFWVRSSVTGTFSASIRNYAGDRSYVATYVINAANTWEYKSITVPGDTTGTWLTNNSGFCFVTWSIGAGSTWETTAGSWTAGNYISTSSSVDLISTVGATFYLTGVQLEVGTVATPFERRFYGQELFLCQRYYWQGNGLYVYNGTGATITAGGQTSWGQTMRITPTTTVQTGGIIATTNTGVTHYVSGVTSGASGNPGIITANAEL